MEKSVCEGMRLGKGSYVYDERTLALGAMLKTSVAIPNTFDFDEDRAPFPIKPFGNDQWGNCVKVGQLNQMLRVERIEHRKTLKVADEQVIEAYKEESFRQFGASPGNPGDFHDQGLVVLSNLKNWRNVGWDIPTGTKKKKSHLMKIAAYGELRPDDPEQLRRAIYLLHGIQLGFWLPRSAMAQTAQGYWDVVPVDGESTHPGSWGGHLVYAKRYDDGNIYVLSWGEEIRVTDAFVAKYCDEAWAVVDDLDSNSKYLNVDQMRQHLQQIGAVVN